MNALLARCAALLVLVLALPAHATPPDFTPLARLIRQAQAGTAMPAGIAIAVVKQDRVVYEGYFGHADIAARAPVTADTGFYIASATKPFFALDVLLQEDAGLLDTRMSLQSMFPDVRFQGFDAAAVDMRDLLVHTSGVDNPPLVWATAFTGLHDAGTRQALVALSQADAKAAHGTFKYSNVGYNLQSVWSDRHFGRPWQDRLQDSIFQPLGMRRTAARIVPAGSGSLALPYSFLAGRPEQPLYLRKADETLHAAGGLVSTAPDLARFLIAQLGAGDAPPALKSAIARSHRPQVTVDSQYLDFPRAAYAWGWYDGRYQGQRMLHHFGGFAGFHAHLSFMPERGLGLVVLSNEDTLAPRMASLIADYAYGVLLDDAGTEARVAQRFDALVQQAQALRASLARQREAIRARPWRLSRPRADYAGVYAHALLGEMVVRVAADDTMDLRWGRLATTASGSEQPEQVRVEFVPGSGQFLDFRVRGETIEAIEFDGMVFARKRTAGVR